MLVSSTEKIIIDKMQNKFILTSLKIHIDSKV